MRVKWMIPGALVLLALVLALVLVQGTGQAQSDLEVAKTVDPGVAAPGDMVIYTVTLSNTTGADIEVSSVLDILPSSSFEYAGLAPGHEWVAPSAVSSTEIRWDGPITVPVSGLNFVYYIHVDPAVPLSAEPYTNTVIATYSGQPYTAQEGLVVGLGEVTVTKSAEPATVLPGGTVTYTVTFANDGYAPQSLATISDDLPLGVTFAGMTPGSDVAGAPAGTTGTIVWTGSYAVPARGELNVQYLATMPVITDSQVLENQAYGQLEDGADVGPAGAEVLVAETGPSFIYLPVVVNRWAPASFTVAKSVAPTSVNTTLPGELVVYTVKFSNKGTVAGELSAIRDTLPQGFTFVRMMTGSQVLAAPSGTTGEIVWTGPFAVAGESDLTLIYEVRASTTPGIYTNLATATVSKGLPLNDSASASVEVIEPVLMRENFSNPSSYWQPFLNYWRLHPEQWYFMAGGGPDGSRALRHNYALGVANPINGAHDALYMFKDPAAEAWTDYTYEVKAVLNADDGSGRGQFGLWFRGKHRDHDDAGLWVTGYYFSIRPYPSKHVYLWTLRTDEECGDDCSYNYHFSNPLLLVDVDNDALQAKGINLKAGEWYDLKIKLEGPHIQCYIDDILVIDYVDNVGSVFLEGTVGMISYIAWDARWDDVVVTRLP